MVESHANGVSIFQQTLKNHTWFSAQELCPPVGCNVVQTDHVTPLLCELHWLEVPEWIRFQLCVLTYRCLDRTAPHYLAETIQPVSSRGTHQHLRSAETSTLLVPSTRRLILGDRSLPVERSTVTRSECIFSFHLPPRTENRSVPVVIPWCDVTMYCALSAPVAQCWSVTMYWLLQTDFINIVRWSCSSSAIMPPKYLLLLRLLLLRLPEMLKCVTVGFEWQQNIWQSWSACRLLGTWACQLKWQSN